MALQTGKTRRNQLNALSEEHREGLSIAKEIFHLAQLGDDMDLLKGIEMLRDFNEEELEAHLQHEEQTIFAPLIHMRPEYTDLCVALGKEHGVMRRLLEEINLDNARKNLADFALIVKHHTMKEEKELFPLIEKYFSNEQLNAVLDFKPCEKNPLQMVTHITSGMAAAAHSQETQHWLVSVRQHLQYSGYTGSHIIALPRFDHDFPKQLAKHLNLRHYDFRKGVMKGIGLAADSLPLNQLTLTLREQALQHGLIFQNAESLLLMKPAEERRRWLKDFLAIDWGNLVLLPIAVCHDDLPAGDKGICGLMNEHMIRSIAC